MTQICMESFGMRHEEINESSFPPTTGTTEPHLPRFNLKKRTIRGTRERTNIPTVTSAFLSGLFADVAKVQEDTAQSATLTDVSASIPIEDADPRHDESLPFKRSRTSTSKAMTRCGKSFKLLNEADILLKSPTGVSSDYFFPPSISSTPFEREDSLHYQLNCVSTASSADIIGTSQAVKLAFPHLTTNASSSNYGVTLPRKVSEHQIFDNDNEDSPKESYGWFVEMDNDDVPNPSDPYAATTTDDLAFSAPTAPKAANYDAEVEWARAADTVDDVLGDFF